MSEIEQKSYNRLFDDRERTKTSTSIKCSFDSSSNHRLWNIVFDNQKTKEKNMDHHLEEWWLSRAS
jgi:hypothetical protein